MCINQDLLFSYLKKARLFSLSAYLIFSLGIFAHAQSEDADLALQYMDQGEYEKAKEYFEKALDGQSAGSAQLHESYLQTLWKLEDHKTASKYLKSKMKAFSKEPIYQVDYATNLAQQKDSAQAEKHLDKYLEDIINNVPLVQNFASHLIDRKFYAFAEKAYRSSKRIVGEPYHRNLASLYHRWGQNEKAVNELMELIKREESELDYAQVAIQDYLLDESEYDMLARTMYLYIQRNPDKIVFNEMLLWYQLMKKDFDGALLQAKAIDRRKRMDGNKVLEIGSLCLNNDAYATAVEAFEYLVDTYANSPVYPIARRMLIEAKELLVKNTYPLNYEKLKSLVKDYQGMLDEIGLRSSTADALRNMALLYAFYLEERDLAISMLEKLIAAPSIPTLLSDKAKLDLGDIYLLKEEPWEATLLYSQVEKSQKDKDLGHNAKLKNAKLSYYNGNFELAVGHLDILKMATSREIANDAMALSLLISDNLNLDTSAVAMETFAGIDLLVFQGRLDDALEAYKKMLRKFPKHSLTDEVYYEMGKIYLIQGRFEEAAPAFREIVENHGDDILGDVSNFKLAQIYEENFKDKQTALELYMVQLTNYPGSIYNVEARKRLRQLRGDKIN